MRKSKSVYVMLAGGLGNQLFQLACAYSRTSEDVYLDVSLANPRVNEFGFVDISDFRLGPEVKFFNPAGSKHITSRAANFILRSGIKPKKFEEFKIVQKSANWITSILLSRRTRTWVDVSQGLDNGYFNLPSKRRNEYLIGYFQSHRWLSHDDFKVHFKNIALKKKCEELDAFLEEEKGFNAVLVHVRLGDYKLERDFGIPDSSYYMEALTRINEIEKIERIWLFSDEPNEAIQFCPEQFRDLVRVVPEFNEKSAVTLEAMRHAKSYVIANSSLSWWGAKLSYAERPLVIAPAPWFKAKPEPTDIVPEDWIRLRAWD
jgi:hypothetical protein